MKRLCLAALIVLILLSGCQQQPDEQPETVDSGNAALDANALDANQTASQDQDILKCADLNGYACSEEEPCFKDFLPAVDTNRCCPIKCVPAPKECSDGTIEGKCSSHQPQYCNQDGNLIIDCGKCSCPEGKSCHTERGCIEQDLAPKIVKFEFTYDGKKHISDFSVMQGSPFALEVGATDDKALTFMYLDDNSFGNALESEAVNCMGKKLCFQSYALQETVAGANTYVLRAVDSAGQEAAQQIIVTINSSCGNSSCESWENNGNCPGDCIA